MVGYLAFVLIQFMSYPYLFNSKISLPHIIILVDGLHIQDLNVRFKSEMITCSQSTGMSTLDLDLELPVI